MASPVVQALEDVDQAAKAVRECEQLGRFAAHLLDGISDRCCDHARDLIRSAAELAEEVGTVREHLEEVHAS